MFGLPKGVKRRKVLARIGGPSLTKQSFKDEADINKIMRKYSMNDIEAAREAVETHLVDLSEMPDFHQAMTTVAEANELFMKIPSNIRDVFNHDPGRFMEFVTDPENREQMVELGLAKKAPVAQQPPTAGEQPAQAAQAAPNAQAPAPEQSTSS